MEARAIVEGSGTWEQGYNIAVLHQLIEKEGCSVESVETQPGEDGEDSVKFAIRVDCDIPCRYNECVSFELIARWRVITVLDEAFLFYRLNN